MGGDNVARYLIIYTRGKTIADDKSYFYITHKKKEYVETLEAVKGLGYTVVHQSHQVKEKRK